MKDFAAQKFAFIDIETTGTSPKSRRIIEVAIIIWQNGKILETFDTLLQPDCSIPPIITSITGIDDQMVAHAPRFADVANKIESLLDSTIFVAHNARFDYGFIKNEFLRLGQNFNAKTCCTVKLARLLFPDFSKFNLGFLSEYFEINLDNHHRALADTTAMLRLWEHWLKEYPEDFMEQLKILNQAPILPSQLDQEQIKNIPDTPGVYFFYGTDRNIPLYIGKSKNLYKRVLSHFSSDHHSTKQAKLVPQIQHIHTETTVGELGALLLESQLVKMHMPVYNHQLRRQKLMYTLQLQMNDNGYEAIEILELNPESIDPSHTWYGCFRTKKAAQEYLDGLVREHGLCAQLLSLEKGDGACFPHQLGRCSGACVGQVKPIMYNLKLIEQLSRLKIRQWPYSGPIMIRETQICGTHEDRHFFDQWCYLGSDFTIEPTLESNSEVNLNTRTFDLDIYKILNRFLKKKNPDFEIRVFPSQ